MFVCACVCCVLLLVVLCCVFANRLATIQTTHIKRKTKQALYTQSRAQFDAFVGAGTLLNNYAHIFDLLIRLRQVGLVFIYFRNVLGPVCVCRGDAAQQLRPYFRPADPPAPGGLICLNHEFES